MPGGATKSEDTFANTLTDLIIMDGITNIRKLGTTSITSIEIPASVNIISRYAFDGNPNLTENSS